MQATVFSAEHMYIYVFNSLYKRFLDSVIEYISRVYPSDLMVEYLLSLND